MPKGDRLKLKADPEDGTTPIANLLLEAVAMTKLSGLQVRALLHLWRETYGWVDNNGKRRKECKITLSEWKYALDSSKSRTASALAELEGKSIIKRRIADNWGGYYYTLNTSISQWNSNCLNTAKLAEKLGIPNFGTVAQNGTVSNNEYSPNKEYSPDLNDSILKNDGTVAQNGTVQLPKTGLPTLYKEILNKDINKEGDVLENPSPLPEELKNKINNIVKKSPYGEDIKSVFASLKERRGYKTKKNSAEAKSIRDMLKEGYTVEQILSTWDKMKLEEFWQGKELFMMSVENQIGAILKDGTYKQRPKQSTKTYTSPDEWRNQ